MDMRSATDLRLLQLAIHITDNKEEHFIPSQQLLPMEQYGDFGLFLVEHIEFGLRSVRTRAANFSNPDNPNTGGLCRGLLDGTIDFLEGSQRLAQGLYEAMDRRVARGDLAVVLFEATLNSLSGETRCERLLALLKLDLRDGFTHSFDQSTQMVVPSKQSNSLPSPREGVQKCAFIQGAYEGRSYDLLVRDAQKAKDAVADFFERKFLDVEPASDSRRQTSAFLDAGLDLLDELSQRFDLSPEQWGDVYEAIYEAPKRTELDVQNWVSDLSAPEEVRSYAQNFMREKLPDLVFEPDASQKRPSRIVYRGDGNLELRIPKDLMVRAYDINPEVGADGEIYQVITIRTKKWETKK